MNIRNTDLIKMDPREMGKDLKEKVRGKMNWKVLLAVFVIIAIGVLLMQTEGGRTYFGQALDALKVKVGNFFSSAFNAKNIFGQQMPSGEAFQISLNVDKKAFLGQTYDVSNSSIHVSGVCIDSVKIGNILLRKESSDCEIEMQTAEGTLEYTESGTVKFSGTTPELVADKSRFTNPADATEKAMKVSFEVLPKNFILAGLVQPKISLISVDGTLERLSSDGSIKSHEELKSENLEIGGFVGYLKLENSNINLQGSAVSVKGTGAHSSFTW